MWDLLNGIKINSRDKIRKANILSIQKKIFAVLIVAFWVTNPCRITRKVKQTKMYVCTLEEFILVDLDTLLCKLELICIGECCSLYTIATIDEKCETNS